MILKSAREWIINKRMAETWIRRRVAAYCGFLGVGLGAFGAHGLEPLLEEYGRVATWETAVFYHLIHAVMLYVLAGNETVSRLTWSFFAAGIAVFSGSLYLLSLTNWTVLGAITPLGGLCLLAGWVLAAGTATAFSDSRGNSTDADEHLQRPVAGGQRSDG